MDINQLTDVSTFKGAVVAGIVSGSLFFFIGLFTGKKLEQKRQARVINKGNFNTNIVNSDKVGAVVDKEFLWKNHK